MRPSARVGRALWWVLSILADERAVGNGVRGDMVNRDREGAGGSNTRSLTVAVHRVSVFGVGAFHAASKAQ